MKLQVTIDRSLFPGIPYLSMFGILFLLFFVGEMVLLLLFCPSNEQTEDILPGIALASSLLLTSIILYIDEKRHGNTEKLQIWFQEDGISILLGKKEYSIPFDEMKEAVRIMQFNRIYSEKGKYKVILRRRKHRPLAFMTTEQEYRDHVDFEDTGLAKFYEALRSHGVKCC